MNTMNTMKTMIYNKCENDTCTICLDEYEEGQEIYLTECQHTFHIECLDKTLEHNNNCPNCRHKLANQFFYNGLNGLELQAHAQQLQIENDELEQRIQEMERIQREQEEDDMRAIQENDFQELMNQFQLDRLDD